MKTLGDRQRHLLRRGATGAALLLAGLLAVVLFIVATGSIVINALNSDDITLTKTFIAFDVVLPGVDYTDELEICIKPPVDYVEYTLTLNPQASVPDMSPYLQLEPDDVSDSMASATLDAGTGDDCDKWEITLTAPHCEGAYNPATDPQGNPATIPCVQERPTADDPQTWSEGSDLGADLEINVIVPP